MIKFNKSDKTLYCQCDSCGEEIEFDTESYISGIDEIKRDGWKIVKKDGEFYTFCCSECKENYLEMIKFSDELW